MTIDQLISLSASVGACLSAVATFWTVRQMAMQREVSYRPELVFSRTIFEASADPLCGSALPERWVDRQDDSESQPPLGDLSLSLRNVGLGAAKAVTITWSFPLKETVKRINQIAQRTLTPAYFSCDSSSVSIKSDSLGNSTSIWENQKNVLIDFVLPVSIESEPTAIKVPHVYSQLCSALLYLSAKDTDSERSFEVPSLHAFIKYADIGNGKHCAVYKFDLNVVAIIGNGESFNAYFESTKCA